MTRQKPSLADARAIRGRLLALVRIYCGGVKQRLIDRVDVPRDTAAKWFADPPRVPDTVSLKRIVKAFPISLDWLVLGREPMEWPSAVGSSWDAKSQLWRAVRDYIQRNGDFDSEDTKAWLRMLKRQGPDQLWDDVVEGIQDISELDWKVEQLR